MSLDSRAKSIHDSEPWECYWFSCGPLSFRYTKGDAERMVNGFLYEREAIVRGEIDQNQELSSGSVEIELPLNNPVALLFQEYLPPRPVSLVIYAGEEGETEFAAAFTGTVLNHTVGETMKLSLVPDQDALKKRFPALRYQVQCPRKLFSPGCSVIRTAWALNAVLTEVSGVLIKSPAFASKPDGYFRGGEVEFPTAGSSMSITAHVGDTLTLIHRLPGLVAGDAVVAFPGCDGTESVCTSKFSNLPNHLGCARIPSKNPFGEGGIR